jgi:hypothetical protein
VSGGWLVLVHGDYNKIQKKRPRRVTSRAQEEDAEYPTLLDPVIGNDHRVVG